MAKTKFFSLTFFSCALCLQIYAEHTTTHVTPPSSSAGVMDRTIEKEYEAKPLPPTRDIPLLNIDIPEDQLDFGNFASVEIDGIEFEGAVSISEGDLNEIAAPYLCCKLTMKEIRELCQKIRAAYAERGYFVARAYPPVQRIHKKILKIQILEGALGKVTIEGNKYYSTHFIGSYFSRFIGQPLSYTEFFRALMLLNDHYDIKTAAIFEKGSVFGTVNVILRVVDHRPLHLYLDVNNYGNPQTTLYRSGGRVDYGNVFFQGDKLTLAEVLGSPIESMNFTNVIYNFPIGFRGLSAQISYLYNGFKVNRHRSLHLKGLTQIGGIEFRQAFQRTRVLSTNLYGSFEYKQNKNYALGHVTSEDKLRVVRLGGDLNYFDSLHGNNYFDFTLHQGIPNLFGGSQSVSPDSSHPGAGGVFTYLYADYKRIQSFWTDFFFIFNTGSQYSFYKLPIPEQFYIGGIDTVRGFPLAGALGDSGYYLNNELRLPPPLLRNHSFFGSSKKKWKDVLQLVVFVDTGGVGLRAPEFPLSKGFTCMTSAGAGIRIYGPYHFDVSFDIGFPLTQRHKTSQNICYWKFNWSH